MEKDIFQMTMSDFVEKYTNEKNEDGMPAIEISDSERFIIDKAKELDVLPYVVVKDRRGTFINIHPLVAESLQLHGVRLDPDELFAERSLYTTLSNIFDRPRSNKPSGYGGQIDKAAKNRKKRKKVKHRRS